MANGRAAKKLIYDTLGLRVKVQKGRGTAHSWLTIDMCNQPLSKEHRKIIERLCLERGYCGSYYTDSLPGFDSYEPCINFWNVRRA